MSRIIYVNVNNYQNRSSRTTPKVRANINIIPSPIKLDNSGNIANILPQSTADGASCENAEANSSHPGPECSANCSKRQKIEENKNGR